MIIYYPTLVAAFVFFFLFIQPTTLNIKTPVMCELQKTDITVKQHNISVIVIITHICGK